MRAMCLVRIFGIPGGAGETVWDGLPSLGP
jgi:hypothetical protein